MKIIINVILIMWTCIVIINKDIYNNKAGIYYTIINHNRFYCHFKVSLNYGSYFFNNILEDFTTTSVFEITDSTTRQQLWTMLKIVGGWKENMFASVFLASLYITPNLQEQQNTGDTNTDKQIADMEQQQICGCSAMRRQ